MADTQQGVRQQSARDAAGTVDTYDGDLRALFESVATVPAGSTYNEAFMLWLQSVTGSSADNINDLAALYASQQDDTYNWSSVGSLGVPAFFEWDAEATEDLTDATFTRARPATVSTTTDGVIFWDQEAKSGELRLDGLRRVQNVLLSDDVGPFDASGGATKSSPDFTFPGASQAEIMGEVLIDSVYPQGTNLGLRLKMSVASGTATINLNIFEPGSGTPDASQEIVVTTTPQIFFVSHLRVNATAGNWLFRIQNNATGSPSSGAGTFTVEESQIAEMQDTATEPDEFAQATVEYLNIGVNGARYFNTTNGNSVDGNGVVTEATGTTITGGGYLTEQDATNPDVLTTINGPEEVYTIEAQITMPTVTPAANVFLFGYTGGGYIIRLQTNLQLAISDGGTTIGGGFITLGQRYNLRYSRDPTQRVFQLDSDSPIVSTAPGAPVGQWTIGHVNGIDQPEDAIFHNISITNDPP